MIKMMKLPTIKFKNRTYTFDYRLKQIRLSRCLKGHAIFFIDMTEQQAELLNYAVQQKDKKLIETNMEDILGD